VLNALIESDRVTLLSGNLEPVELVIDTVYVRELRVDRRRASNQEVDVLLFAEVR
jgi:hypothetical protein